VDHSTLTATAADLNGSAAVAALAELLAGAGVVVVLSGAGLSTESGIPDYRGPTGALRRHAPMSYLSFISDEQARHRYWARSYVGWRQISRARPNAGHRAVARLQAAGALRGIVTQNVDGLHQAAGARDVIELHGGLDRTVCLTCGDRASRASIDSALQEANPAFDARVRVVNPDGDVELSDADLDRFVMVTCAVCRQGPLKPDVVFFGETVPRARVERCYQLVEQAKGLLVLGSSLAVMSGYRFVVRAVKRQIPVAVVNQGSTRADACASIRVDAPLGAVLPTLAAEYERRRVAP
jgi:NAD-dependent SIR2 family protein deacetylase